MSEPVELSAGEAIRLTVENDEGDEKVYAVDDHYARGAELRPKGTAPDRVVAGGEWPTVRLETVSGGHVDAVVTHPEDGGAAFERDLALRQAKLAKTTLQIVKWSLNENRPLRALDAANEELERLDEELDAFDELDAARGGDVDGK